MESLTLNGLTLDGARSVVLGERCAAVVQSVAYSGSPKRLEESIGAPAIFPALRHRGVCTRCSGRLLLRRVVTVISW